MKLIVGVKEEGNGDLGSPGDREEFSTLVQESRRRSEPIGGVIAVEYALLFFYIAGEMVSEGSSKTGRNRTSM